jgi:hypothetical protein
MFLPRVLGPRLNSECQTFIVTAQSMTYFRIIWERNMNEARTDLALGFARPVCLSTLRALPGTVADL